MTAEDLLVHDGGDGQAVEAVGKRLPQLDVESAFTCGINREFRPKTAARHARFHLSRHSWWPCNKWRLTLIVEAVDAVDGGTLVVAPEQEEVLGVFDLVRQQQTDGLQRLLPSVHVVAQEQVVGLRGEAAVLKEPQQICVLSMDVTWGTQQSERGRKDAGGVRGELTHRRF